MGLFSSKKEKEKDQTDGAQLTNKVEGIYAEFTTDLEKWEAKQKEINDVTLTKWKNEFIERPDYFLANALFLSPQFYENFEREKDNINKKVRDVEAEYNKKLAPYHRTVQFIGAHEAESAQHALYSSTNSQYYENCGYKQIYVIQENVQLFSEDEYNELQDKTYCDIKGPSYRLCLEPSRRHAGYVRLRCADIIPGVSRSNTYEDLYRATEPVDDECPDPILDSKPFIRRPSKIEEDDIQDIKERPNEAALIQRRPSGRLPVGYITKFRREETAVESQKRKKFNHLLNETDILNSQSKNANRFNEKQKLDISDASFKLLHEKLRRIEEDEEEEEEEVNENAVVDYPAEEEIFDTKKDTERSFSSSSESSSDVSELSSTIKSGCFVVKRLRITSDGDAYGIKTNEINEARTYLSSERYRTVFQDDFEDLLKTTKEAYFEDQMKIVEPSILTEDISNNAIIKRSEYTPAFNYSSWPLCALEWQIRERKARPDPVTKMKYSWPKKAHIDEIVGHHGVTVVPMGFYDPKCPTRVMMIEWQFQFVRAEQILLRSLGAQQVKVLLMIQFMFRDHIEKKERLLRPQVLRYVLFWLCEHNYRDWQDDRLALNIKLYLKTLYDALSKGELLHYFVRKINMFDNIKPSTLRAVQATVRIVMENLPMYLMHTMSRLRYKQGFYPQLKIKKIYQLVTLKKYGIEELNPKLKALNTQEEEEEEIPPELKREEENGEDKAIIMMLHHRREERKQEYLKKKGQVTQIRKEPNKTVDLNIKIGVLNDMRAKELLLLFAQHYVDIAICSNRFQAHPQAYKYLRYAENMLNILTDDNVCKIGAAVATDEELENIRKLIHSVHDETRKGLNEMLSRTHRLTDAGELVIADVHSLVERWNRRNFVTSADVHKEYSEDSKRMSHQYQQNSRLDPISAKELVSNNKSEKCVGLQDKASDVADKVPKNSKPINSDAIIVNDTINFKAAKVEKSTNNSRRKEKKSKKAEELTINLSNENSESTDDMTLEKKSEKSKDLLDDENKKAQKQATTSNDDIIREDRKQKSKSKSKVSKHTGQVIVEAIEEKIRDNTKAAYCAETTHPHVDEKSTSTKEKTKIRTEDFRMKADTEKEQDKCENTDAIKVQKNKLNYAKETESKIRKHRLHSQSNKSEDNSNNIVDDGRKLQQEVAQKVFDDNTSTCNVRIEKSKENKKKQQTQEKISQLKKLDNTLESKEGRDCLTLTKVNSERLGKFDETMDNTVKPVKKENQETIINIEKTIKSDNQVTIKYVMKPDGCENKQNKEKIVQPINLEHQEMAKTIVQPVKSKHKETRKHSEKAGTLENQEANCNIETTDKAASKKTTHVHRAKEETAQINSKTYQNTHVSQNEDTPRKVKSTKTTKKLKSNAAIKESKLETDKHGNIEKIVGSNGQSDDQILNSSSRNNNNEKIKKETIKENARNYDDGYNERTKEKSKQKPLDSQEYKESSKTIQKSEESIKTTKKLKSNAAIKESKLETDKHRSIENIVGNNGQSDDQILNSSSRNNNNEKIKKETIKMNARNYDDGHNERTKEKSKQKPLDSQEYKESSKTIQKSEESTKTTKKLKSNAAIKESKLETDKHGNIENIVGNNGQSDDQILNSSSRNNNNEKIKKKTIKMNARNYDDGHNERTKEKSKQKPLDSQEHKESSKTIPKSEESTQKCKNLNDELRTGLNGKHERDERAEHTNKNRKSKNVQFSENKRSLNTSQSKIIEENNATSEPNKVTSKKQEKEIEKGLTIPDRKSRAKSKERFNDQTMKNQEKKETTRI